jgi:hypothetical protein
MFNLIVKDPYSVPPKRCRLDRGLNHSVKVSSNLLRGLDLAASLHRLASLATFPILSDLHLVVKLHLFASGPPNSLLAVRSLHSNRSARKRSLNQKHRSRKISKSDQRSTPEPIGLTGDNSWVLRWLVLCGIPYRGSGLQHQIREPAFQLPFRAGQSASGKLNQSSATFQEYHTISCLASRAVFLGFAFRSFLRLPETAVFCKLDRLWRFCFSATSSSYRRLPFLASFAVVTGSALVQLFKTNTAFLRLQAASIFQVIAALSNCKIQLNACPELHSA